MEATGPPSLASREWAADALTDAVDEASHHYNNFDGGFSSGGGAKFPQSPLLSILLAASSREARTRPAAVAPTQSRSKVPSSKLRTGFTPPSSALQRDMPICLSVWKSRRWRHGGTSAVCVSARSMATPMRWPAGASIPPAWLSYFKRIADGPDYALSRPCRWQRRHRQRRPVTGICREGLKRDQASLVAANRSCRQAGQRH